MRHISGLQNSQKNKLMDKYYKAFVEVKGNRDVVFDATLNHFKNKPINILEIGCARNLNLVSRKSDGWSTCFWADYISKNQGHLTTCDISENSINNCKELISHWLGEKTKNDGDIWLFDQAYHGDYEVYNLVFLDGGDNPQETLDQYNGCVKAGVEVILIDDFHTKGVGIEDIPDTRWIWDNKHEMAAFGLVLGTINLIAE